MSQVASPGSWRGTTEGCLRTRGWQSVQWSGGAHLEDLDTHQYMVSFSVLSDFMF